MCQANREMKQLEKKKPGPIFDSVKLDCEEVDKK